MFSSPTRNTFIDVQLNIGIGSDVSVGGNHGGIVGTSAVWPSANRAIYVPFRLNRPIVVQKLYIINGAAVSGNIDLGIYDAKGTRLTSSGSTAQAGISVPQEIDITDITLGRGVFYMACAIDNITAAVLRGTVTLSVAYALGMANQDTAFALPATATFVVPITGYIPFIGLLARSFT